MYERILVCIDNSERAASVARAAADLAVRYNAHVLLLCVHEPPQPEKLPYCALSAQSVISHEAEQQQKRAREAAEILQRNGVLFDLWQRTDNPADAILQTAKEQCIDLIVMGSREQHKGWAWLNKSVVQRVARHAPCTVMQVTDTQSRTRETGFLVGGLGREAWSGVGVSE